MADHVDVMVIGGETAPVGERAVGAEAGCGDLTARGTITGRSLAPEATL